MSPAIPLDCMYRCNESVLGEHQGNTVLYFFKDFIYLFMRQRERERERERERQRQAEGEAALRMILESQDPVPRRAPCLEPTSPSACVSASPSLSLSLSVCLS